MKQPSTFVYSLLLLLFVTFSCFTQAQNLNFQWVSQASWNGVEISYIRVNTDPFDGVYVGGDFQRTATFDTVTAFAGSTGTARKNAFLARYDTNGTFKWLKNIDGGNSSFTTGIAADDFGNVYICGQGDATSSLRFDSDTVFTLIKSGGFIARYDTAGNFKWALGLPGVFLSGITIGPAGFPGENPEGDIFVSGEFLGAASIGNLNLNSTGGSDAILCRFNGNGNLIWHKTGPGAAGSAVGQDITCRDSLLYVAGYFTNSITLGTTTLQSAGGNDIFIARYTLDGTLVWAKRAGGIGYADKAFHCDIDPQGNLLAVGQFDGTADFGGHTLSYSGNLDRCFLVKYDPNGNALWARDQAMVGWLISGPFLTIDPAGDIYFSGEHNESSPNQKVRVAKYNSNGQLLWQEQYCTQAYGGALDFRHGSIYTAGYFHGNTGVFGGITKPKLNTRNLYVAKIAVGYIALEENAPPPGSEMVVYPNPAQSLIRIGGLHPGEIQLELLNSAGKLIWEKTEMVYNQEIGVNLQGMPAGMYFLRVSGPSGQETFKVVLTD
ncbi:MAG: T9SS type A sorting domain-containing protein [Bacteroidia bacterium]|nr:T9SS type A sorting domain-containing protein [Bacteroidia bacterium]